MTPPSLRADCGRCAALCCVAYAFESSPQIALDKPAGVACPHLDRTGCRIHARRTSEGFRGCVSYTCNGAGQYVTSVVFGGADWRDDATLTERMCSAFLAMVRVQECRLLLQTAASLPLPLPRRLQLEELSAGLEPPCGWSEAALSVFVVTGEPARIAAFLRGLSDLVPDARTLLDA